ncbi:hypothetical protein Hanom_Chr12g01161581 [Helianthus anomalus]
MFVPNFRRCPLFLKLISFVLNVSKSCTLCPLRKTQLIFFLLILLIKGYFCLFTYIFNYYYFKN